MRLLLILIAVLFSAAALAKPLADMQPEQLLSAKPNSLLILDVRSDHEFDRGHIPGAIHIPQKQLGSRLKELEGWRDKSVVVYCESGYRANIAASLLEDEGFSQVYHLVGDMRDWRQSGRAIAF